MIAITIAILAALALPILSAKREPPAESSFASDPEPSPNIAQPSRVYVSRKPETLFDVYNDFGFRNVGPLERVPSFAQGRSAPTTQVTGWGSHEHYSASATKAERAAQEAMDPTPTGWGKHSHFLPGSEEKG
jgi:hypothetical protein